VTDIVYLVRSGERNEELRYSLRSLANMAHGDVWFVGDCPRWVKGVRFIRGNLHSTKPRNVFYNLLLACDRVPSEQFVVMNDDFFITKPTRRLPAGHRCKLDQHIASLPPGVWHDSLVQTRRFLTDQGLADLLSFELHMPVLMNRAALGEVLMRAARHGLPPQWRTLYGNWWQVPSRQMHDVKLRTKEWKPNGGQFLSTEDWNFRYVRPWLEQRFSMPSPYEKANALVA
jgi:hypothetical protein